MGLQELAKLSRWRALPIGSNDLCTTGSTGDLGTNPTHLEKQLKIVLTMGRRRGALLLLDEADVFLQRRSPADLNRNALVSVFPRELEDLQWVCFLKTNDVQTFDAAITSRIYLSLRYPDLNSQAKRTV